jgi:hypothetical protein
MRWKRRNGAALVDAFAHFIGQSTISAGGVVGAHRKIVRGPDGKIRQVIRCDIAHIHCRIIDSRGGADVDFIPGQIRLGIGIPAQRRDRV